MYGRAEAVVGRLLAASPQRSQAFVASKVWTQGRDAGLAQLRRSVALLQTRPIDLMQVHNLLDWRTQLAVLADGRREGLLRHIGLTHYTASAHADLEAVLRSHPVDAIQVNYAMDDRAAERRLLPVARERGVAVIVNRPFGGGGLLKRLLPRPLPGWAAEIECQSWAQVLLKCLLANPAVTCVIPGTSRARHMADNAGAGRGPLPDAALLARISADLA